MSFWVSMHAPYCVLPSGLSRPRRGEKKRGEERRGEGRGREERGGERRGKERHKDSAVVFLSLPMSQKLYTYFLQNMESMCVCAHAHHEWS